jgi:hypothetical protein
MAENRLPALAAQFKGAVASVTECWEKFRANKDTVIRVGDDQILDFKPEQDGVEIRMWREEERLGKYMASKYFSTQFKVPLPLGGIKAVNLRKLDDFPEALEEITGLAGAIEDTYKQEAHIALAYEELLKVVTKMSHVLVGPARALDIAGTPRELLPHASTMMLIEGIFQVYQAYSDAASSDAGRQTEIILRAPEGLLYRGIGESTTQITYARAKEELAKM